jgi:hypothetical protein
MKTYLIEFSHFEHVTHKMSEPLLVSTDDTMASLMGDVVNDSFEAECDKIKSCGKYTHPDNFKKKTL